MNRRTVCLLLILCQALLAGQRLSAWDGTFFDLLQIPFSARSAALGGTHVALVDGVGTLFGNPAGFRSAEPELKVAESLVSIYDSGPSIINEVLLGEPPGSSATRRAAVDVLGPLFFGYVGNGLGFGIFNNTKVRYWTWGPYPQGYSIAEEDFVLISGYSFGIPLPAAWDSTLDVGFTVPLFASARSDSTKDIRGLLTSQLTLMGLIATEPFTIATGAGIEVGTLYSLGKVFSVGVVARNLGIVAQRQYDTFLSFAAAGQPAVRNVPLPMDLTVGIMWSPPVKDWIGFLDGFSLMVDYRNAIDFLTYTAAATDPLLHISAGVELQLLKILYLRAGFYQMLPSFGLELDLTLFKVNLAMIGRELSTKPGGYPIFGYMLGLTL
jgi:hypothetical protein